MSDGIYAKTGRVRPPRVHITYEVERDGALQRKELPFVLGVLADLSGRRAEPLPRLRDRAFVAIDRDSFDDVLQSARPRLALRVPDRIGEGEGELAVALEFGALEDFAPERVVRQVAPLRELLELRGQLKDLLSRMEGNDRLEQMLEQLAQSAPACARIAQGPVAAEADASAAPDPDAETSR